MPVRLSQGAVSSAVQKYCTDVKPDIVGQPGSRAKIAQDGVCLKPQNPAKIATKVGSKCGCRAWGRHLAISSPRKTRCSGFLWRIQRGNSSNNRRSLLFDLLTPIRSIAQAPRLTWPARPHARSDWCGFQPQPRPARYQQILDSLNAHVGRPVLW